MGKGNKSIADLPPRGHRRTESRPDRNRSDVEPHDTDECTTERKHRLTQTRVHETVPDAADASDQPPSLRTGREAERRPQDADQQVAEGDADQQQVHGCAQRPIPTEQG